MHLDNKIILIDMGISTFGCALLLADLAQKRPRRSHFKDILHYVSRILSQHQDLLTAKINQ